jgi:mRNA interferase MazF
MARPGLKRGDLVIAAFQGDFGKPRPCVVVQSDRLTSLGSVLLCPLTSDLETTGPARLLIPAAQATGLERDSLVMVDKITAVSLSRCRRGLGKLSPSQIDALDEVLGLVIGLAD